MRYRPEIDGLRALAVLPVVLFHAGVPFLSGGFVGVDVFFVISGYLMYTLISEEITAGRFSFVAFYRRRILRIWPALFVMIVACTPLAIIILSPSALTEFAESMLASVLLVANLLFKDHSGYFATAAELQVLLHVWSLSVEEQFYLVLPLSLVILFRFTRKIRTAIFVALAVLSFSASQWQVENQPSEAFFFLLPRVWEFLFGVLAAYLFGETRLHTLPRAVRSLGAVSGVLLIAFAATSYSNSTPFPGLAALVPTIGAALAIAFADTRSPLGCLLSSPLPVFFGRISFSLYLWHFPLQAFARNLGLGDNPLIIGTVTAMSVGIAYLSWRYIESPARAFKTLPGPVIFGVAALCATAVALLGIVGITTHGLRDQYIAYRLDEPTRANFLRFGSTAGGELEVGGDNGACVFRSRLLDAEFVARFETCARRYGKAHFLIGDSHAINIHNALEKAGYGPFFVSIAQPACRPYRTGKKCQYEPFVAFAHAHPSSIAEVMLHMSGSHLIRDDIGREDSQSSFVPGGIARIAGDSIQQTVEWIGNLPAAIPVLWLGPFAEARVDLTEPQSYGPAELQFNAISSQVFERLDGYLKQVAHRQSRFRYLSLVDALGRTGQSLIVGPCLTFRDADHYSECGEQLIGPLIADAIRRSGD